MQIRRGKLIISSSLAFIQAVQFPQAWIVLCKGKARLASRLTKVSSQPSFQYERSLSRFSPSGLEHGSGLDGTAFDLVHMYIAALVPYGVNGIYHLFHLDQLIGFLTIRATHLLECRPVATS